MQDFVLIGALLAVATAIPLAWKWRLGVSRAALVVALLGLAIGTILFAVSDWLPASIALRTGLLWALTLAAALIITLYRFYRDPERKAPARADVIVSPADGEIIYVRKTRGGALPVTCKRGKNRMLLELTKTRLQTEDGIVVGIAMNFLDVHVNRAPISGRVSFQRHFPGQFGSLRLPEMIFENERMTTLIENSELQIAVVQIASRLVRQIASFVQVGASVTQGQRIGVIRLGSQVDLVLPRREGLEVLVTPGARVRAGESLIAVLEKQSNEPAGKVLRSHVDNLFTSENGIEPGKTL
jgi:phosphatidylserine decarboxylase